MDKVNWRLVRYSPAMRRQWDDFVAASRNASFMHMRGYMDYHADRFSDHSLLAFKGDRLLALLPADITPGPENHALGVLHSHRGLTYGGWLLPGRHLDGADLLEIFAALRTYCRRNGISALDYKAIPFIYPQQPSQEDIYALFREGAVCTECNISEALVPGSGPGLNTLRRRHLRKASSLPSPVAIDEISSESDIAAFHAMLSACLRERHSASPVHSLPELLLIRSGFPDNIRFFVARYSGDIQAGVCVYDYRGVAHTQYIATTPLGRELNLLTPLFCNLIENTFSTHRYLDFGTSNESGGRVLNAGLLRQKASYGATGVAYQRFYLTF